ncbi:MAG: hypothetical protein LBE12_14580 [Planctomycetaceae bacterium]|jgi:hypothetical protein|nr:hypothetical protein [Planctomycetaceae bacterium]
MKALQIDVKKTSQENTMKINIYINGTCYPAYMDKSMYDLMLDDGCFIRDGKTADSANVVNTTEMFFTEKEK